MSNFEYLFKMIIVGDSSVGKSCTLFQYLNKRFNEQTDPTIGIEFANKELQIDNTNLRLQIWDSAGQENYWSITRSYYRGVICAILVYDITSKKSFQDATNIWYEEAQQYGNTWLYFSLVGNKTDLEDQRAVSYQEGESFALKHNMFFCEITAKNYEQTKQLFEQPIKQILQDIKLKKLNPHEDSIGVKIGSGNLGGSDKQKKSCCK